MLENCFKCEHRYMCHTSPEGVQAKRSCEFNEGASFKEASIEKQLEFNKAAFNDLVRFKSLVEGLVTNVNAMTGKIRIFSEGE